MKTESTTYNLLNSISYPEDLRKLSVEQLPELCKKATGKNLFAENLAGVFNRPRWDVSFHVNMADQPVWYKIPDQLFGRKFGVLVFLSYCPGFF